MMVLASLRHGHPSMVTACILQHFDHKAVDGKKILPTVNLNEEEIQLEGDTLNMSSNKLRERLYSRGFCMNPGNPI